MALEMVQYGVETTRGTAVAATKKILGKVKFALDQKVTVPSDDIGLKVSGYRGILGGKLVTNILEIERGYFQALPLLFSLLLKGGVTPTEVTASQGDYLWDFTPSYVASNTPKTITLEAGDSIQGFENEYVMGEKLKISGSVPQDGGDAAVSLSLDFFGRQNTKAAFTSAIALPIVNELSGYLARLYVDATWAAVGTTEKTAILRAFDIEIIGGNYPQFHGGQALTFDSFGEGKIAVMATLTLDTGADALALYDALGAMKVFKLLLEGPQIGSGTKHSLDLAFSGLVMEPEPGASKEKETSLTTIQIEGIYDVTGAKLIVPTVTTNSQTI